MTSEPQQNESEQTTPRSAEGTANPRTETSHETTPQAAGAPEEPMNEAAERPEVPPTAGAAGAQERAESRGSHVLNIGTVFVSLANGDGTSAAEAQDTETPGQEKSLFETLQPMRPQRPQFPLDPEDLRRWTSELTDHRLLILSCYDSAFLRSASHGIAADLAGHFSAYQLSIDVDGSANPFLPSQRGDPSALVVVDATSLAPNFLDAVINTLWTIDVDQQTLRETNRLLLVLTNDRILGWTDDPSGMQERRAHVPCLRIPSALPGLKTHYRDNWKELYDELCKQREAGDWPADEEDFYERLTGYLGQDRLPAEIEKRRRGRIPAATERTAAVGLLSPRTPLENAVFFVATFFPNLSMRDFERLVLILLGDRTQMTKTSTFVLDLDGEGRSEEVDGRRMLREVWSETYPEVLLHCQLHAKSLAAGSATVTSVIDFTTPELREGLRDAFFGAHAPIFLAFFRCIKDAHQLFEEAQEIVSDMVRLMVDAALANPQEFAGPRLGGLLPLPISQIEAKSVLAPGGPPDADVALPRFYPCLRAFMQKSQLRGLVTGFLTELLLNRSFSKLADLAWTLRDVAEFDALSWFKRLFDEGDEEARRIASAKLRRGVRSRGAAELIEKVFGWLRPSGGSGATPSAAFARRFYIDLGEDLLFTARRRQDARLAHPLLAAARAGGVGLEEVAVSWLFHPEVAHTLRERARPHFERWISSWLIPAPLRREIFLGRPVAGLLATLERRWSKVEGDPVITAETPLDLLLFPAFVLADWAVEIFDQELPADANRALYDRLLAAVADECDGRHRQRRFVLAVLWMAVEASLLDVQVFLEKVAPRPTELGQENVETLRVELQRRRRCVKRLRLDLQAG
jgi:hypothetical protein